MATGKIDDGFRKRTVKRRRYLSKTSEAMFEISSAACATRGESRVRVGIIIDLAVTK